MEVDGSDGSASIDRTDEDQVSDHLCSSASCRSVRSGSMDSEFLWQTTEWRNCFYEGYRYEEAYRQHKGITPTFESDDDELRFKALNLHSDTTLPRAVVYIRTPPSQLPIHKLRLSSLVTMRLDNNRERCYAFQTTTPASRLHTPPSTHLQAKPDGHGVVDDSARWSSKNKGRSVFIHVRALDVTDPNEEPVTIEIYNCFVRQPLDEVLPRGSIVRLKAPILTLPSDSPVNDMVVRVDHPSDIEVLYPEPDCNQTAQEWKALGDESFQLKRFYEAVRRYTQAIRFGDSPEIRLNRSAALLEVGRYDECISDCEAVLQFSHNFKALYRRAKAAYHLMDHFHCLDDFVKNSAGIDSPAVKELLSRIHLRSKEIAGFYDWPTLTKEAESTNYLHCAPFQRSLEVRSAGQKGRGVFATEDIEPGTVIVVAKAEAIVFHQEEQSIASVRIDTEDLHFSRGPQNELGPLLCQAICDNPSKKKRLYDLDQGLDHETIKPDERENRLAPEGINGFRMYSVSHYNAFATDTIEIELSSLPFRQVQKVEIDSVDNTIATGVWHFPSYFNHSCLNNCTRLFLKNIIIIKTNKKVNKGEELTLGYVNKLHDYLLRNETFSHFGFDCSCQLCMRDLYERKAYTEMVKGRKRHMEKYDYSMLAFLCGPPITNEKKKIEYIPRAISLVNFVAKSYELTCRSKQLYLFIKPLNNLLRLYLDVGFYDRALETARRMANLVGIDTMDDLVLGIHTLIPAILLLNPFGPSPAEEKLERSEEMSRSFAIVAQAWRVRGLVPGFEGYWADFGEWWSTFVYRGRDTSDCELALRRAFSIEKEKMEGV